MNTLSIPTTISTTALFDLISAMSARADETKIERARFANTDERFGRVSFDEWRRSMGEYSALVIAISGAYEELIARIGRRAAADQLAHNGVSPEYMVDAASM